MRGEAWWAGHMRHATVQLMPCACAYEMCSVWELLEKGKRGGIASEVASERRHLWGRLEIRLAECSYRRCSHRRAGLASVQSVRD